MIALISARQELQLVPARSERPTALTLVLPGRTAAAICKMPTPKQVAGNGEGHAEPGIGVDIGRADEALHRRVGDAIILRQRLAGKIEGDGIRSMLGNSGPEFFRHEIERLIPAGTPPSDSRVKQPVPGPDRLGKRRSLGTETAEIRR